MVINRAITFTFFYEYTNVFPYESNFFHIFYSAVCTVQYAPFFCMMPFSFEDINIVRQLQTFLPSVFSHQFMQWISMDDFQILHSSAKEWKCLEPRLSVDWAFIERKREETWVKEATEKWKVEKTTGKRNKWRILYHNPPFFISSHSSPLIGAEPLMPIKLS